ncbi:MAG TPA: protein kinase [Kofleriaceae bacterium]|nr:protein kinase [Kofleriaceae bacterium]
MLAAKYRVERVLGAGGMGVVVAATHLQLDQVVALKFVLPEALYNPEVRSRFEREARAAVRLKSEHVARIIDVGRLESGSPYIVMEYLEGQDLAQLLAQHGPLPVALACDYIIQACDAIAEAHSLGIVHRDLKPGNLFLARTSHGQQTIKVLDFGISKSQSVGDVSMTRTDVVMGSPGYMSPEQMRSTRSVDGRTDLWSLGIILYELVAGRMPFQADTFSGLCVKIAVDPHAPLPVLPSALPQGFEAVINHALEKNPVQRFQSAAELAQALAPYATAQWRDHALRLAAATPGVRWSAAHLALAPPIANTLDAAAGQARVGPAASRSRALIIAGSLIAVVAIGVAIGGRRPRGDRSAPDSVDVPASVQPAAAVPPSPDMPVRVDADVVPPPVTAPAETASAPPPVTAPAETVPAPSAASPTAKTLDSGVAVPAPTTPNKLKVKPPPPIDPYSSPD